MRDRKKVKLCGNSKIYSDLEKMLKSMVYVVNDFPRQFKYSVGESIINHTITCLDKVTAAYLNKDLEVKMKFLLEFESSYRPIRTLMRLSVDEGWISFRRQAQFIEYVVSIDGQLTAWKSSLEKQIKGCTSEPQGES